mgnify:CR=1 FL=1
MIALDTHVWVYLISDDKKQLSQNAIRKIDDASNLAISAISCWEAALLFKKGRLKVKLNFERWIQNGLKYPKLKVVDPAPQILIKSVLLDGLHPDPADRIIAATCLLNQLPLITKDQQLHKWNGIETIW